MANEIQELKFQVGEVWKGVYSSSTPYSLANVVQDTTGLSIYRSLKSGNVGHPVSDASWWFRIIDMSSIKTESDRIKALNDAIADDEALRVAAEELRQQHEAERVAAEIQRNEAEQARISAEQERVNKESQREAKEQQRITAEQGRVSAESARVQAEQARALAETLRANAEDQRAANEQNRVAAEQQRIERAEQDHQRAESDHAAYVDSLGAFDISSYHAIDGVLAKYADLAAALGTNGANIPDTLRKGGMSVKFVQSSDNKYVQFRLMAQSFTTDETQWQDESNVIKKVDIVKYGDNTQRISGGGGQNIGLLISSEGILKRINVNIAESSTVILRVYDQVDGEIIYNESFSGSAGINHFSLAQNIRILPGYIVSVEGKVMYNSTVLDQIFYQYLNNRWSLRVDKARFQYYIEVDESILNDLDKLQDEIDDINDYLGRNIETITIGDNTTRISGGGSQNVGLLIPQDGQVSEIYCNVSGNGTIEVSVYDKDKSTLLITKTYSVIDGVNTIPVSGLSVKQGNIINIKGNLYYNSTTLDQIFYQYLNNQWSLRTDKARFQVAIKIESVDVITEFQNEIDELKSDNIIYVGSNREIKKITDALALGLQKPNIVIILDSEEFDIIDELGDDYMSQSFTGAEDSRGIELYNNITIKGTGNSVIKAHYLGNNADARSKFSVFSTKGSFTLDNIILDCKNIRYCVHDEQGNRTIPYKVQYLGCSMKIDNSENNDWPAMQCIGGGLGKNGIIIIKDCVFDAVLTTEYFRDSIGCVTYHNNGYDANSKSNLIVNGNYFKASTFALMWYGSSTKITECLLSNNSFETPVLEKATTQSATVINTKIIGWNNIIRGVGN